MECDSELIEPPACHFRHVSAFRRITPRVFATRRPARTDSRNGPSCAAFGLTRPFARLRIDGHFRREPALAGEKPPGPTTMPDQRMARATNAAESLSANRDAESLQPATRHQQRRLITRSRRRKDAIASPLDARGGCPLCDRSTLARRDCPAQIHDPRRTNF